MPEIIIYSSPWCPYCVRAKRLLDAKNAPYTDIDVSGNSALRAEMMQKANAHTVPQIWIAGVHVGGCDDLYQLERAGRLDELLAPSTGL